MRPVRQPLYARLLRLRHLRLHPVVAFLLFEGSIGLGVLVALAEITTWWGVIVVPVAVAAMVKLNDVVAGALAGCVEPAPPALIGSSVMAEPGPRIRPPLVRGASARRTMQIIGRARLGSARGIVYVHPQPGSLRRPWQLSVPDARRSGVPAGSAEPRLPSERDAEPRLPSERDAELRLPSERDTEPGTRPDGSAAQGGPGEPARGIRPALPTQAGPPAEPPSTTAAARRETGRRRTALGEAAATDPAGAPGPADAAAPAPNGAGAGSRARESASADRAPDQGSADAAGDAPPTGREGEPLRERPDRNKGRFAS